MDVAVHEGGPDADGLRAFRRNVAWAAVGNAIYAGCQWAMLVALARLGTPDTVGEFAIALAVTAPLFLLAGLQLRGVQATDSRREFTFGDYLGLRVLAMGFATAASLVVAGAWGGGGAALLTVAFVSAAKSVEGLSDVHYGWLQSRERLDVVARSLIARGGLSLLGVVGGMIATRSAAGAAAGMALAWLAVLVVHDVPGARRLLAGEHEPGAPRFDRAAIRRLVTMTAPLGVVIMLISLQTNLPRYVIERHVGTTELGIFAALASLVVAGNVFVGALGQAASPRLARLHATGELSAFRGALLRLLLLGAVVGAVGLVVAILAGRPLLQLLFGPVYAARAGVFVWVMVGGAIAYLASLLGYAMTAARQFRAQVPLTAIVLVVLGGASLWLVPRFGLAGAAWAVAIASAVHAAAAATVVLRSSAP